MGTFPVDRRSLQAIQLTAGSGSIIAIWQRCQNLASLGPFGYLMIDYEVHTKIAAPVMIFLAFFRVTGKDRGDVAIDQSAFTLQSRHIGRSPVVAEPRERR